MNTSIYPGSFDPLTNGHLDIITRGAKICDSLIVIVAHNSEKKEFIPLKDRLELVRASTQHLSNVKVASYSGALADYAAENNIKILIRGLRNFEDFEHEERLAFWNKKLNPQLETIFLLTDVQQRFLSSRALRELIRLGKNIDELVPAPVARYLSTR